MSGIPAGAGSLIGKRLGKYEILALLALGGTAEIYLARIGGAAGFEKYVVVKCLHDHLADDQEFVKMFLDEARLAAHLDHSNIVQTMELGEHENRYYMVMEFLAGLSLAMVVRRAGERLPGGRVPVPLALNMVAQSCAGLHYAHEKAMNGRALNIVHRDISPQNLVVSFEGVVKVVDFGIAKAELRETQTRSGTIKGKFAYMSPEQCVAGNVDRRTDVFALGVIAHELLTGRRLFKKPSPYETYQAVIDCQVEPPSKLNIELDPAIDPIVMQALAKEKENRYPTAEAFGDAILGYLHHRAKSSSPGDIGRFLDVSFAQEIEEHGARMRELITNRDFAAETGVGWGDEADEEAKRAMTRDLSARGSELSLHTRDLQGVERNSKASLSDVIDDMGDEASDAGQRDDDDGLPAERTRIEANPLELLNALDKVPAAPKRHTPQPLPAVAAPVPPPPRAANPAPAPRPIPSLTGKSTGSLPPLQRPVSTAPASASASGLTAASASASGLTAASASASGLTAASASASGLTAGSASASGTSAPSPSAGSSSSLTTAAPAPAARPPSTRAPSAPAASAPAATPGGPEPGRVNHVAAAPSSSSSSASSSSSSSASSSSSLSSPSSPSSSSSSSSPSPVRAPAPAPTAPPAPTALPMTGPLRLPDPPSAPVSGRLAAEVPAPRIPSGAFPDLPNMSTMIADPATGKPAPAPVPASPTAAPTPSAARRTQPELAATQVATPLDPKRLAALSDTVPPPMRPLGPNDSTGLDMMSPDLAVGSLGPGARSLDPLPQVRPSIPSLAGGYPVMDALMTAEMEKGASVFPGQPAGGRSTRPTAPPGFDDLQRDSGQVIRAAPASGAFDANRAVDLASPVGRDYPVQGEQDWATAAAAPARALPAWMLALFFLAAIAVALTITIVLAKLTR